ncbi:MAG: hypothetical protein QOF69_2278, partial [Solirubrobacteraceae bacterium]|nr:hypothetical protein [Solirubrobacteraceae bacterium]
PMPTAEIAARLAGGDRHVRLVVHSANRGYGAALQAGIGAATMRRTFHMTVRDVDCAFKLIRRELIGALPLTCNGAMISTELLVGATAAGARIEEIGVHHHPRVAGVQSGAAARVVLRAVHAPPPAAPPSEPRGIRGHARRALAPRR